MVNRRLIKWEMQLDRGGQNALCDLCGVNFGTQQHEIVNRGRTVGNEAAREASYDKHICSLLCAECHTLNNLAERNAETLLAFNVGMYGIAPVLAALQVVQSHLHTPLNFDIDKEVTKNDPQ